MDSEGPRKKKRGRIQNTGAERKSKNVREEHGLCADVAIGEACHKEDGQCKAESHSVEAYLAGKEPDIGPVCYVYEDRGYCPAGYKCRWLGAHLIEGNVLAPKNTTKYDKKQWAERNRFDFHAQKEIRSSETFPRTTTHLQMLASKLEESKDGLDEEGRTLPNSKPRLGEKRRIEWKGAGVLSPLTTTGNIAFRRLCKTFGANITYSEMALSLPLLQGLKSEWSLPRAHCLESRPTEGHYYGVQIAASKAEHAAKVAEVLANRCDGLDFIDLNCGCPLDLVYNTGAGSGLLNNHNRLIGSLNAMHAVSLDIPITAKIRMGTKDNKPTAKGLLTKIYERADVSAVALHGRSRQQRYARRADWEYIAECGEMIRSFEAARGDGLDNGVVAEYGELPQRMAFIGNGDCYTWQDWQRAIDSGVDTTMIARGALIKPWIFEEIEVRQNIDKSSSERLDMLRSFANFGLDHWGSDTFGLNITRRFLCEFLSFFTKYVPVGILPEYRPLHDRPPTWEPRNDMERLLSSQFVDDWIKVTELFLGPTPDSFKFIPKHKSSQLENG